MLGESILLNQNERLPTIKLYCFQSPNWFIGLNKTHTLHGDSSAKNKEEKKRESFLHRASAARRTETLLSVSSKDKVEKLARVTLLY